MRRRTLVLWCIAQVLVAVVGFLAFFSFAPWVATLPIAQAPPEARRSLPKDCPAFHTDHGTYVCDYRGTIREHPWAFRLNVAVLLACWGFLVFTGLTGRGFPIVLRGRRPPSLVGPAPPDD
jgi:hypothetical protein